MSAIADKLVSFNVHGVLYVGEEGAWCILCLLLSLTLLLSDTVAPIEREIRDLANGLKSVKDEQEYIVVRERRHRNTAESTNARVKWWSVFQAVVLFSVAAWQVYYLKVCSFCTSRQPCSDLVLSHSSRRNARSSLARIYYFRR
jgi:p24 family protein beta-1